MILVLNSVRAHTDGGNKLFFDLVERSGVDHEVVLLTEADWGPFGNWLVAICYNRWFRYAKRHSAAFPLFSLLFYHVLRPLLARRLIRQFSGRRLAGVWTQSNDVLPLIAADVASALRCALHVSVQDLPYTFVMAPAERRYLANAMTDWLKVTTSCDVQTPAMEQKIRAMSPGERTYLVLWSSAGLVDRQLDETIPAPGASRSTLRIAYCGSLRFASELRAFVRALELLRSRGTNVELRLFTTRAISSPVVVWKGYVADRVDLLNQLAGADAALSHMSFAPEDRELIETSFPGKIATYLAARLPIIAFGPETASNVEFVMAHGVGVGITSVDPETITAALENFEREGETQMRCRQRIAETIDAVFSDNTRLAFFMSAFTSLPERDAVERTQTAGAVASASTTKHDEMRRSARVR